MKEITYNDINIVHEDNHILVVVKPRNLPTQLDESGDKSLLCLLKEYIKVNAKKEGNVFLGLVHRLDRPTGGVMVFAKTSKGAMRLAESMKEGEFEKRYFAVTIGIPKNKQDTLEHYLYKDVKKNEVYTVPMATVGAKHAVLNYRVLQEIGDSHALLSINLITGRSHQARVQLSAINAPIFGDQKYSAGKSPKGHNLALWATELRFPHPTTRQVMVFKVHPPDEIPWNKFGVLTSGAV